MQWIDSTETYSHEISKDHICKKKNVKCISMIKQYINV